MNGTKLDIIEKGKIIDNFMLNQASSIISSNYTEDNDGIVDRVAIYNKSHKKIGQISNASWVKQYGVYQATLTAKSGGKAKAKKMLKSKTREAEINGIGDNRCVAGCGIWILDKSTGLKGKFWIESDSHTWEGGAHSMDLKLTFQNAMETPQSNSNASSKSSGKYVSTGILNGRKVKAYFTAYEPLSGQHLDTNYKCAAPSCIKKGTKIQCLSMHGSGKAYNNKVYTVNDRGTAIVVDSKGYYHIDLLMKTYAEACRFGAHKGYIIIGNGTGYKRRRVGTDESSDKGDKICNYARKFVGKVTYHWAEARPDIGRSDCSGFTMYVYAHSVHKSIPHSSEQQAKMGGSKLKVSQLKRGDLMFWHCPYDSRYINHVSIYYGNGKTIQVGDHGCTIMKVSTMRAYGSIYRYGKRLV